MTSTSGTGMAWLASDLVRQDYVCYWYAGKHDGHLIEQARASTAAAAVAWGRLRTPRVRIRMGDSGTYWAGNSPAPAGFAGIWDEAA